MPKGLPKGEPEEMLDKVENWRHRREVDALLDQMPFADTFHGQRIKTAFRQALVGGVVQSVRKFKPLASVPKPSDKGTKRGAT